MVSLLRLFLDEYVFSVKNEVLKYNNPMEDCLKSYLNYFLEHFSTLHVHTLELQVHKPFLKQRTHAEINQSDNIYNQSHFEVETYKNKFIAFQYNLKC